MIGLEKNKQTPARVHWLMQRISAAMLALLMFWVALFFYITSGQSLAQALELLKTPWHAAPFSTLMLISLYHGMLGLEVVIEDYIASIILRQLLLLLLKTFTIVSCFSFAAAMFFFLFG